MSDTPNCYDCVHRRSLPGESHSACHHPSTRSMHEGGGLLGLVAVLGKRSGFSSIEPSPEARALKVSGDPVASARGWFLWPVNFDPRWLRSCAGFQRREQLRAKASKLAIVDRLLPLLEAYGASRARQSIIRKEMKAAACTHPDRDVAMPSLLDETRTVPCFDSEHGRTPWCDACRQHDQAFTRLMAERSANKKRFLQIERLAVAYAEPEPEVPPEPKELLELMHSLDQEAGSGEAAVVREGDHEETRH